MKNILPILFAAFCAFAFFILGYTAKPQQPITKYPIDVSEEFPAGQASVSYIPHPSLMHPAKNLQGEALQMFHAGKALAHQPWIKAPTVTFVRDGLGPIYNARTCLACHINGGRGRMPDDNKSMLFSSFLR